MKRIDHLVDFISSVFGNYSAITATIKRLPSTTYGLHTYRVKIGSTISPKTQKVIMRVEGTAKTIQVLIGEDYFEVDEEAFLMQLFLENLLK